MWFALPVNQRHSDRSRIIVGNAVISVVVLIITSSSVTLVLSHTSTQVHSGRPAADQCRYQCCVRLCAGDLGQFRGHRRQPGPPRHPGVLRCCGFAVGLKYNMITIITCCSTKPITSERAYSGHPADGRGSQHISPQRHQCVGSAAQ